MASILTYQVQELSKKSHYSRKHYQHLLTFFNYYETRSFI